MSTNDLSEFREPNKEKIKITQSKPVSKKVNAKKSYEIDPIEFLKIDPAELSYR